MAITVSSGDAGYGTEWPAASPFVTAVGGTSLSQATHSGVRNGSETAWSSGGSGCSAYETKPTWQNDSGCANRTVADVSAVADPEHWRVDLRQLRQWRLRYPRRHQRCLADVGRSTRSRAIAADQPHS